MAPSRFHFRMYSKYAEKNPPRFIPSEYLESNMSMKLENNRNYNCQLFSDVRIIYDLIRCNEIA